MMEPLPYKQRTTSAGHNSDPHVSPVTSRGGGHLFCLWSLALHTKHSLPHCWCLSRWLLVPPGLILT